MNVSLCVKCAAFPCADVRHARFEVPGLPIRPETIKLILISEAPPAQPGDGYYAGAAALFAQTTREAFNDAGADVGSVRDILRLGVYLTTAVKCAKTSYLLRAATISECSRLLEKELALFPNVRALLLMGDAAILALNAIARRAGQPRVIPAVPTYKLRGQEFYFQGKRVFPSYLQAGPSFFIEKSKRKMIAEDIAAALALIH